jgi:protein TonB
VLRKIADAIPAYPPQAKTRNVEGWVDVAFTVDPDGRTTNVRVISAQPATTFDAAAVDAVRRWRYAPLPVAQDANVRLRFRLER